jgi:hypothetical protein
MLRVITQLHLLAGLCCACASLANAQGQSTSCIGVEGDIPEISGIFIDNFAGWHSVGPKAWLSFGGDGQAIFAVCRVDNDDDFIIAQNSASDSYNPLKYSRIEWHESNGQLFYCHQVFDATTEAEAADVTARPLADRTDLNDSGCGNNGQFAWSSLARVQ